MSASLVGSEMCIRDSPNPVFLVPRPVFLIPYPSLCISHALHVVPYTAVSYTHLTLPTICSV
eukprot:14191306-Alexandrium_andersonii.AAC.1